jgi:hypothetical protein
VVVVVVLLPLLLLPPRVRLIRVLMVVLVALDLNLILLWFYERRLTA